MNYYETLYIVHPALESGRLKDIILSIQETLGEMNVNVISTDVWGKKKLAYLIDKQKYGTYVLVQFSSDGQSNTKIATELEHNPNILSYLTSKIDEDELQKDLMSLDDQIGGIRVSDSKEPSKEQTEEPTKEPAEEPAKEPAEESTEEPAEESTEEPAEEPAEESTEEPAEESTEELNNENSEEDNHGAN